MKSRRGACARGAWALAAVLTVPCVSAPARAELGDDLDRLTRAYRELGRAAALPPRLLERGDALAVSLPPWAFDPRAGACTTVTLIAPTTTHFVLHTRPTADDESGRELASTAGIATLTRCGDERVALLAPIVEMRSPRAVVHTVVLGSEQEPPPLERLLPNREAGPSAPWGEPGPPPSVAPVADRLSAFATRAAGDGATGFSTELIRAGVPAELTLDSGCHRWLLTATSDASEFSLLVQDETGRELNLPSGSFGDLTTELCVASRRRVRVLLAGPAPGTEQTLAMARFPLPERLPERFGPEAAEGIAEALGASRAPRRLGPLARATFGVQGLTRVPGALLPRRCYLAAVTVLHGESAALAIGASPRRRPREEASADGARSARLAFCTGDERDAELTVEARGAGVAWLLALFDLGAAPEDAG